MGVAMVAAGVDVTVIRSWLGHVSLDTTNHYARANLETKRQALQQVDTSTRPTKPPRWKRQNNAKQFGAYAAVTGRRPDFLRITRCF
jgi:hypothetical protein